MDDIDRTIIVNLERNSRIAFLEIARKLHVSEGTIRKRVAKLQKEGIIKKFTIEYARPAHAIIGITINPHVEGKKMVAALKTLGVTQLCEITGRFDILTSVYAESMKELYEVIEKIRAIDGVSHTETFTVLRETSP